LKDAGLIETAGPDASTTELTLIEPRSAKPPAIESRRESRVKPRRISEL
jgi:hypothetical protein